MFQSKIFSATENMKRDEVLLNECDPSQSLVVNIHNWKRPSLTYGYFINPKKFLNLAKLDQLGIDYARRCTGGGIIFHLWDLSFGVVVPKNHPGYSDNTLKNYAFVNQCVIRAVKRYIKEEGLELLPVDPTHENVSVRHFCMAKPTIYDVMLQGRKVAGAAQRKKANGYLHQGTISLTLPDEKLLAQVLLDSEVLEAMKKNSYALVECDQFEQAHEKVGHYLIEELQNCLSTATLSPYENSDQSKTI